MYSIIVLLYMILILLFLPTRFFFNTPVLGDGVTTKGNLPATCGSPMASSESPS
jgi:hypothetical protein